MNQLFKSLKPKQPKYISKINKYKNYFLASTLLFSTTFLINNSLGQQNNEDPKNAVNINKVQNINEHEKYNLEQQRKGYVRIYGPSPDNKSVDQIKAEMEELRNNQLRGFITNVDKKIETTISKTLNTITALFNFVLYHIGKFIFFIGATIFSFIIFEPIVRFFKELAKRSKK